MISLRLLSFCLIWFCFLYRWKIKLLNLHELTETMNYAQGYANPYLKALHKRYIIEFRNDNISNLVACRPWLTSRLWCDFWSGESLELKPRRSTYWNCVASVNTLWKPKGKLICDYTRISFIDCPANMYTYLLTSVISKPTFYLDSINLSHSPSHSLETNRVFEFVMG